MLTVSVLLSAEFFGIRIASFKQSAHSRTLQAETLALQLSSLAAVKDITGINYTLGTFVENNTDVLAASMASKDSVFKSQFGSRESVGNLNAESADLVLTVPILDGNEAWGEVKVLFKNPEIFNQNLIYFLYVLGGCFISYLCFLNRALVLLDPGRVVPTRVNTAFNMFSEGVIILDEKLRILLANDAISESLNVSSNSLVGQSIDKWEWQCADGDRMPWRETLASGLSIEDLPMRLPDSAGADKLFVVSTSTIGGDDDKMRGVFVTLDNMTAIEQKNNELAVTLRKLRRTQEAIEQKNKELETLATKDPLTGLSNRRALLEKFEKEFSKAIAQNTPLSCVLVDIDYFKKINDGHGHAVGDEIICAVAKTLLDHCRDEDMVGRYGGEEFLFILPGLNTQEASAKTEQIRIAIEQLGESAVTVVDRLSASFGVADLSHSPQSIHELIEFSDQALYLAKQRGRNQVVIYQRELDVFESGSEAHEENVDRDSLSKIAELESLVQQRNSELANFREFDAITGSPKERLFVNRVETEIHRADRFGTQLGVLSFEIKNLDRITRTLGVDDTNRLIVKFVERLKEGLRKTDMVATIVDTHNTAQFNLNEYCILLTDIEDFAQAISATTRLRRLLSDPFKIGKKKMHLGISIGVALYPQGGEDVSSLVENAAIARIEAAEKPGKVTYAVAKDSLDQDSAGYMQLETDLYDAVENQQFEVYFQPKLDLGERRVRSVETLIRWNHPERGFISPAEFIPIVEANGLIHEISNFVLSEALRNVNIWQVFGLKDINVSVNISPVQLREPNLVDTILSALDKAELPGEVLEIELTETAVIESPARAQVVLNGIRESGVRISMDDFGTGYTSLSLLAELPLDSVKIDRSFVASMEQSAKSHTIVESVIKLAKALDLWVVAEGVETTEQLTLLDKLSCDEIQGFLIAYPMTADDTLEYLKAQIRGPGKKAA